MRLSVHRTRRASATGCWHGVAVRSRCSARVSTPADSSGNAFGSAMFAPRADGNDRTRGLRYRAISVIAWVGGSRSCSRSFLANSVHGPLPPAGASYLAVARFPCSNRPRLVRISGRRGCRFGPVSHDCQSAVGKAAARRPDRFSAHHAQAETLIVGSTQCSVAALRSRLPMMTRCRSLRLIGGCGCSSARRSRKWQTNGAQLARRSRAFA